MFNAAESRAADFPVEYISSGPVMENVVTGDDVNLTIFPTPTWHELDGGPGTVNIFRNMLGLPEATWKERAEREEEHDGEYSIPDSKQRTYF